MIANYFKFYILQLMLSASYLKDSDSQNIKKFKSKRQKLDNVRLNFFVYSICNEYFSYF